MQLKDAISAIQKKNVHESLQSLYTPWGEEIKKTGMEYVWQENPRPLMERNHFHILNGWWSYWVEPVNGSKEMPLKQEILVPFSPESLLSGVERQLAPNEYLWYERELNLHPDEIEQLHNNMRCLLHFGAVDQIADVYFNGDLILTHEGGYLPFDCDITDRLKEDGNLLQVRVRDFSDTSYYSRGKQKLERGGMFYTAQSGIWQTVWYEWVPENYIQDIKITPSLDTGIVEVEITSPKPFTSISCTVYKATNYLASVPTTMAGNATVSASYWDNSGILTGEPKKQTYRPGERTTVLIGVDIKRDTTSPNILTLTLPKEAISPWTPEEPYLYAFTIMADNDKIRSYFALRTFTIEPDEQGVSRFCLNHTPYFLHGVLDQGYWSDGLMTAPCDDAFLYDIGLAKKTGFNMIRKHVKIEPLRWYYHCDRLGMIVWQDMVNGGGKYNMNRLCYLPTLAPNIFCKVKDNRYRYTSRGDAAGRAAWEQEIKDTVKHLYNVPCIATWSLFNEGWGQFDSARLAEEIRAIDPNRTIDAAGGWFDQHCGDYRSVHNYFRPLRINKDKNDKRAFVISEYGGYTLHLPEHSSLINAYGYKRYDTEESLNDAFQHLTKKQLFPLSDQGLCGAVYTQLSDIEEEVNGVISYDRRVIKLQPLDAGSSVESAESEDSEA